MATKKRNRMTYEQEKERALQRIRLMVLYLEIGDPDDDERAELEQKIRTLARTRGLQKLLRSYGIL